MNFVEFIPALAVAISVGAVGSAIFRISIITNRIRHEQQFRQRFSRAFLRAKMRHPDVVSQLNEKQIEAVREQIVRASEKNPRSNPNIDPDLLLAAILRRLEQEDLEQEDSVAEENERIIPDHRPRTAD